MGTFLSWVIGIALVIGLHVLLLPIWPVLVLLWVAAALIYADCERDKAVRELKRLRDGSWIDPHHEHLEELRAEHDAYRRGTRNDQTRAK